MMVFFYYFVMSYSIILVVVSGVMNRRTASLLRACVAYTYITIPSIVSPVITLKLYIQSASIALIVCCLPQVFYIFFCSL